MKFTGAVDQSLHCRHEVNTALVVEDTVYLIHDYGA